MKGKRIGRQTVQFSTPPVIRAAASVVGRKEGEGPLRDRFDSVSQDTYFGEKSWEQAESAMLRQCFARVCSKAALEPEALDYVLSGDLLNQCVGSAYAMRGVGAPRPPPRSQARTFAPPSGSTAFRWNTAACARRPHSGR